MKKKTQPETTGKIEFTKKQKKEMANTINAIREASRFTHKIKGEILLMTAKPAPVKGQSISEWAMGESQKLLDTEQYLNNEVATEVYKRFGVAIRIHLFGGM